MSKVSAAANEGVGGADTLNMRLLRFGDRSGGVGFDPQERSILDILDEKFLAMWLFCVILVAVVVQKKFSSRLYWSFRERQSFNIGRRKKKGW